MKIGIITSGIENLILCKPLLQAGHELVIFADQEHAPYSDHHSERVLNWIDEAYHRLVKKGVDHVIVGPAWELLLTQEFSAKYPLISPVFQKYVLEQVLPYSLVGKLGILGGWSEIDQRVQKALSKVCDAYTLNPYQQKLSKFQRGFPLWSQDVSMWINRYESGYRMQECINTIIKTDVRIFKDAAIDTLIPLNYGALRYEKNIAHFLNFKKIRFHGSKILYQTLEEMFGSRHAGSQVFPPSEIIVRGHLEHRSKHKQLIRILTSGNRVPLQITEM